MLQGVAVDRFTGGSAPGKKFKSQAVRHVALDGVIGVDLTKLRQSSTRTKWPNLSLDAALGLLALTLRDLREGDIRFGFGAAKGYGEFLGSARVTGAEASVAGTLGRFLSDGVTAEDRTVIRGWIDCLHRVVDAGEN